MKYRKAGVYTLAFCLTITAFGSAFAEDLHSSGFLSDYSQLKQSSDNYMNYRYVAEGAQSRGKPR